MRWTCRGQLMVETYGRSCMHADGWMDSTRLAFQASWTASSSLLLGWQEPPSVVDLTSFEEETGG